MDATKQYGLTSEWMTTGDVKGRSPLQIASIYGYKNVVEFLVKEVIKPTEEKYLKLRYVNFQDYKGRTSLFYAVSEGHFEIMQLLVGCGADINIVTNRNHIAPGSTALMACAEKNELSCFDFLLSNGANILATREDGSDAMYIAARHGHQNIIQRIMEIEENDFLDSEFKKLIVNRPTFRGRTAFLTAAFHGHDLVCRTLLKKVVDLNHQDDDGITALMYAAREGKLGLVQWLVSKKVNLGIKSRNGETAIEYAVNNKQKEVAKFLRTCLIKPDDDKIKGRRASVAVFSLEYKTSTKHGGETKSRRSSATGLPKEVKNLPINEEGGKGRRGTVAVLPKRSARRASIYPGMKLA